MYNIEFQNGTCIIKHDDYTVYCMHTEQGHVYYMSVPTNSSSKYEMILEFPTQDLKNFVEENNNPKLPQEISKTINTIYKEKKNAIYILPNITQDVINKATTKNNSTSYNTLKQELKEYTCDACISIIKDYGQEINIDQVISIINKNKTDQKIINWFNLHLAGFFKEYKINTQKETFNPTIVENIFEEDINQFEMPKNLVKIKKRDNNNHGSINIITISTILIISATIIAFVIYRLIK